MEQEAVARAEGAVGNSWPGNREMKNTDFLAGIRIDAGKRMLESGMSVSDTCSSVGFENLGSFCTLFKRSTGKTPDQYRREKAARIRQMNASPLTFIPAWFARDFTAAEKSSFRYFSLP